LKIGYFVSTFPYKNPRTVESLNDAQKDGGVENVAFNLVVEMAKRGHEIRVFTSSIDSISSVEDYDNIKIYRYKKNFSIGECPISLNLLYKPLFSTIKLDIVHSHLGNLPAPLAANLYARIMKKNLIVSYHGDWVGGFGGTLRRSCVYLYDHYLCKKILSRANIIIAPSKNHMLESKFLKTYLDKLCFVSNGVSIEEFDISYSKEECRQILKLPLHNKIILFVGSLNPIKAPHILIKAMNNVLTEVPEAYLIFIGDGICRNKLLEITNKLGIISNVKFLGYVNDNYLKALYYKSADVFVLPSMSESFGIVLLEASASGLPLIATDLESLKAVIQEGYNGLLVKNGDYVDLAHKIVYLLNNEMLRSKMGKNSREKVEKFSWKNVANEVEQIYLDLV